MFLLLLLLLGTSSFFLTFFFLWWRRDFFVCMNCRYIWQIMYYVNIPFLRGIPWQSITITCPFRTLEWFYEYNICTHLTNNDRKWHFSNIDFDKNGRIRQLPSSFFYVYQVFNCFLLLMVWYNFFFWSGNSCDIQLHVMLFFSYSLNIEILLQRWAFRKFWRN